MILDNDHLDALASRHAFVLRIRMQHGLSRCTLERFVQCPDVIEARCLKRLRDWADNPRGLQMAQTDCHLN